jgi:glycine dehydrogenase
VYVAHDWDITESILLVRQGVNYSILKKQGFKILNEKRFFDTLEVQLKNGMNAEKLAEKCAEHGVNIRVIGSHRAGISFGESVTKDDVVNLLTAFEVADLTKEMNEATSIGAQRTIPEKLQRTSAFLTHPVFNSHHSETQMLRYMKSLENKDLSLNYSMISLGSCTMKLNASIEMMPVTWNEVCNLHPFAPKNQVRGFIEMIESLNRDLADIPASMRPPLNPIPEPRESG